jgi:hypothetical protein
MELTEFLLARIAEDEAVAREAMMRRDRSEPLDDEPWRLWWQDVPSRLCVDPTRVLAECEAKRRIVADAQAFADDPEKDWGEVDNLDDGQAQAFANAMRALASVYRDHPDFDPAWAD